MRRCRRAVHRVGPGAAINDIAHRGRQQRHAEGRRGSIAIRIHEFHRHVEIHRCGEDRGGAKTRDDKWVARYVSDLEAVKSAGRIGSDCCIVYQPVDDHRPIRLGGDRKGMAADNDGINKGGQELQPWFPRQS